MRKGKRKQREEIKILKHILGKFTHEKIIKNSTEPFLGEIFYADFELHCLGLTHFTTILLWRD